ncbi:hypothetical protein ACIQ9Q_13835 [Streptomyces sp. NPDC094438]|uniref:hypothetical protein n=1 Tax=Streptomyces sp. NPDC094438 TaxID=3366061 RepID=UPI0038115920
MSSGRRTPWWYRVPPLAVSLITLSVVTLAVHPLLSDADDARWGPSLGIGLATGLAAAFVQGMAQRHHDRNV